MALHYFDTSGLAKRYIEEAGSAWVTALVASESVAISELTIVEMASALSRLTREGRMTHGQSNTTFQLFIMDIEEFTVFDLSRELLRESSTLLLQSTPPTRLRSLDAIHLASAKAAFAAAGRLGLIPGSFVGADRSLLEVARSLGLSVSNPEDFP